MMNRLYSKFTGKSFPRPLRDIFGPFPPLCFLYSKLGPECNTHTCEYISTQIGISFYQARQS